LEKRNWEKKRSQRLKITVDRGLNEVKLRLKKSTYGLSGDNGQQKGNFLTEESRGKLGA
jgi:recombinational DNA repair ATPase RecF